MLDTIVRGGRVVSVDSVAEVDVGIKDGRIALMSAPGTVEVDAERSIDASGCYVVPGGIDVHVHFRWSLNEIMTAQAAGPGSLAAAYGGTTTFIDFAFQRGEGGLLDAIEDKRRELKADQPNVDYALHGMLTGPFPLTLVDEMDDAIADGVTSYKMFTTFGSMGGLYADDGRIFSVMEKLGQKGGIALVHCEDDCIVDINVRRLFAQGRQQGHNIHLARPNLCEEAAINRMVLLAKRTNSPLYIVHVSSREGLELISESQAKGQPVYGESLHNYLAFTSADYRKPDGMKYHNFPSLKSQEDQDALWQGLKSGMLQTVASDDFTIPLARKLAGQQIDDVSGGHNGIETRMGYMFSEGVARNRLSVMRMVEVTSTLPAKLFGLYPRKGVIAPGSDADLVLIDPTEKRRITLADLHSDCDYSLWDGWEFTGWPRMTMLRGHVLVNRGKWEGPTGIGEYIATRSPVAVG
jgi:dihydropyrimidinase